MANVLHITSGDYAGALLQKTGLPGEVFVWHDTLYDGPRNPGWPTPQTIDKRAEFLEESTGGGLKREDIKKGMLRQYSKLEHTDNYSPIVLWFDACLFDQSMLTHILTCLKQRGITNSELICVDSYEGIVPFNGLGQLTPEQLAGLYNTRKKVTNEQFEYADIVDQAFASQDISHLRKLASANNSPLPWVAACAERWLKELPDSPNGLGFLEECIINAVHTGKHSPAEIFKAVAMADTPPQYWGDTTLWQKINHLADRTPPLLSITGPEACLPQWGRNDKLAEFRVDLAR